MRCRALQVQHQQTLPPCHGKPNTFNTSVSLKDPLSTSYIPHQNKQASLKLAACRLGSHIYFKTLGATRLSNRLFHNIIIPQQSRPWSHQRQSSPSYASSPHSLAPHQTASEPAYPKPTSFLSQAGFKVHLPLPTLVDTSASHSTSPTSTFPMYLPLVVSQRPSSTRMSQEVAKSAYQASKRIGTGSMESKGF